MTISNKNQSENQQRKIFISHRHRDSTIANALRTQLQAWGIPEDCIFQSSHYKQSGKIGRPIRDSIKAFLEQTKLVILIYTHPDMKWDYCMYECGLATDPATVETSVIVFQCTEHAPRVFQDELLVVTDQDGIARFTRQFHKDDDFFPELSAFAPDLDSDTLNTRSDNLLKALSPCLPKQEPRKIVRWGYFTLSLAEDLITTLQEADTINDSHEICVSHKNNMIVTSTAGFGLRHFGYQNFEPNLSLEKIIQRWQSNAANIYETGTLTENHLIWVRELEYEICRSVRNESPQLSWIPMKSVYPDIDWWVCPVISEINYESDGSAELNIHMYRMDKIDDLDKGFFKKIFIK